MASFNKAILIGNLTADPELKQTQGGESVCSFTIGVSRKFAKNGECDFINVVTWRKNAEFVCQWFKKGNPILVCGQLQTRNWTDNTGAKRYVTEVVADEVSFVASAPQQSTAPTQPAPQSSGVPNPMQWGNGGQGYTPQAYTQPGMNFNSGPQFEEIPNDESLPF